MIAENQRIDEKANQGFNIGPISVSNGSSNSNIGLAGIPEQQQFVHSQQRHKQGTLVPCGQLPHGVG